MIIMKLKLKKSDPPVDRALLDRFMKSESGIMFPEDYIRFLMTTNGGEPVKGSPDSFWVDKKRNRYGSVGHFYPFRPKGKYAYNPEFWWSEQDYMPRYLFPVATDATGNYVMLVLEGSSFGCVIYSDHEMVPDGLLDLTADDAIKGHALEVIATSFEHFIEGMFPESKKEDPF